MYNFCGGGIGPEYQQLGYGVEEGGRVEGDPCDCDANLSVPTHPCYLIHIFPSHQTKPFFILAPQPAGVFKFCQASFRFIFATYLVCQTKSTKKIARLTAESEYNVGMSD